MTIANTFRDIALNAGNYIVERAGLASTVVAKVVEGKIVYLDTVVQIAMGKPVDEAVVNSIAQWAGTA